MLTLIPDLNVAPLKYAHVHREHGGPIHSLSFTERGGVFEAFAFLDVDKLGLAGLPEGPHGQASAASKPEAIHRAISRAIELWAWSASSRDTALSRTLRFDLDPTRHGFRAFPGLGSQGARKRALFEAARKWTSCAWWEGQVQHTPLPAPGSRALLLKAMIPGVSTVLLWEETSSGARFGVGTSFSPSAALAAARAVLGADSPRARHFASGRGLEAFRARLARPGAISKPPSLAVDCGVPGPWHQYAHVWRCLFDCSRFHEKDSLEYFYF